MTDPVRASYDELQLLGSGCACRVYVGTLHVTHTIVRL